MPRGRLPTGMAVITLFFAPSIRVMSPPFSLLTHTRNEFAACEAQSKPDHKMNPTRRVLFILIETLGAFRPADKQETDRANCRCVAGFPSGGCQDLPAFQRSRISIFRFPRTFSSLKSLKSPTSWRAIRLLA